MLDLEMILNLPIDHRQVIQEVISYSVINDLKMQVFSAEQKQFIEDRLKRYCNDKDALFKFEDLKSKVVDKLP